MFKGFKEFITRGNAIDLAVGVVIGAAFGAVITAIVTQVFDPLIGAIFDAKSLAKAFPLAIPTVSGGTATIYFGAVIAALINFLLVAIAIYFFVVLPMNKLKEAQEKRRKAGIEDEDAPITELDVLTEIRDLLSRGPAEEEQGKHQAQ